MSEEKELPLMEDFRECLALVKKCRSLIEADPVLPNGKGGTQTNPALTILINQQAHLASLADIIGPIRVEKELADEFREARNLSRSLMPGDRKSVV